MNPNDRDHLPTQSCCPGDNCGSIARRHFIKSLAVGAAAAAMPVMAGPFAASEAGQLVPADKKLDPKWVESLFARGQPAVYRGADLEKIGMPVGGICAGQLYLGGDGKLWHWDIFNELMHTGGSNYAHPPKPSSPLEQGFAIQVTADGQKQVRSLDRSGFCDITFCGEYPIGYVQYHDPGSPVSVSLEAFSPFIPLDPDNSSLPATVIRFTVKNTGKSKVDAELAGWLENVVGLTAGTGRRRNHIVRGPHVLMVACSLATSPLPTAAAAGNVLFEDFQKETYEGWTQIVDKATGPWGNIGVAEIVFTDRRPAKREAWNDVGTMALALLEPTAADRALTAVAAGGKLPEAVFSTGDGQPERPAAPGKLIGGLLRKWILESGQEATATFVIAWHFPHLNLKNGGRFYASRFKDAAAVAEHVAENFKSLYDQTCLWHDTWYDSTLPYWFLDRTFLNTSILATSTCHWFHDGRFYGWEGVGCCEGTCTHVWHYAHAVARLFPQLERDVRRRTDFGTAIDLKSGVINYRGEGGGLAVDGQAGCILRAYREHQMSADGALLKELWPKIKLAMQCLIRMDDGEGILEGPQHNTLDQPWFGKVAWLTSLYLAALRACEEMAKEVGDAEFARQTAEIFQRGTKNLDRELFNGEYYYHIPDKAHVKSVGSHDGCEIDQVFGQSWAYQVALGRLLPEEHTKKALASLWEYNFAPDVGPFRAAHKTGRWFAMAGEGGLLMCSWPKGEGARVQQGFDSYFNECMTGFEYQVAGHMIWEGMVTEGLAISRAIHDRYHPARRNPWNEVECGDHYARAMASYGVFLAACGFEYHGPKRHLAFAPRLSPANFRAAFTTAEGWGTFSQTDEAGKRQEVIRMKWGKLQLKTLAFAPPLGAKPTAATVTLAGKPLESRLSMADGRAMIALGAEVVIEAGQELTVTLA